MLADSIKDYNEQGFLSPVQIICREHALRHRHILQDAEQKVGTLHYQGKAHSILCSAYELATHSNILDIVEQILGPNILLYDTTYIIKEANSSAHVSWHQDLTYWGLDSDEGQVSVWLALSVADVKSGCMRMIPGSHLQGQRKHTKRKDDRDNVLLNNQTVYGLDEEKAVYCPLDPGQASFHHGWTLHCSAANGNDDRRIGLNIQYIAPHVRQTKLPGFSALLVRGEDHFHHYEVETPPTHDLDPKMLKWRERKNQLYLQIAGTT